MASKARTALTVYQAQERQLAIQKKKGALVDRARAETLVFRLARQERDVWVTWPSRVAALMAAEVAAEVEKQSGQPVIIEAAILQRVLETVLPDEFELVSIWTETLTLMLCRDRATRRGRRRGFA